jgi:hypothetical protein
VYFYMIAIPVNLATLINCDHHQLILFEKF